MCIKALQIKIIVIYVGLLKILKCKGGKYKGIIDNKNVIIYCCKNVNKIKKI